MKPNRQVEGGRLSATLRYVPDHPTRISVRAANLTTDQQRRIRDAILAIRDELDDAQVDAEANAEANAEKLEPIDWPDPELAVDDGADALLPGGSLYRYLSATPCPLCGNFTGHPDTEKPCFDNMALGVSEIEWHIWAERVLADKARTTSAVNETAGALSEKRAPAVMSRQASNART
jgi:hypothetical protein